VEPFDPGPAPSLPGFGRPFHVGITTVDLAAAMRALAARFDLQWTPLITDRVPGLSTPEGPSEWSARRVHSLFGPLHFEVFQGSPGSTWQSELLLHRHHWAYWSKDVTADSAHLQAEGWSLELFIADGSGRPTDFAYLTAWPRRRVELVDVRRQASYYDMVRHQSEPVGTPAI
jgi:hypothetical protein